MEFISQYMLFLAKIITFIVAIGAIIAIKISLKKRAQEQAGELVVIDLNEFYQDLKDTIDENVLSKEQLKKAKQSKDKEHKKEKGSLCAKLKVKIFKDDKPEEIIQSEDKDTTNKPKLFVLDFDGDIKASTVDSLKHEISAVINSANSDDEVLLRLTSSGGYVHAYGLASAQLARLRSNNIQLTIAVDTVAASGGYMMAVTASKLLSAPFAVIGSIGVIMQLPNFNRFLKKYDVDVEMLTAGEYKRTLTVLGRNTDKGRQKQQEVLENTHILFRNFIQQYRPKLDIDKIATGETWYGTQAQENGLVDEITTSDDYILSKLQNCKILHLAFTKEPSILEKFGMGIQSTVISTVDKIINTHKQEIM